MSSQANYGGLKQHGGRHTIAHSEGLINNRVGERETERFSNTKCKTRALCVQQALLLKHICPPSISPAFLLGKFQYSQNSVFCGDFPFGSCDWRLLNQKTRSEQCIICQSMRSCNRERWVIITIKLITVKYGLLGWCLLTEVGLTKTEDAAICPVDYRLDNLCHCPRAHLCLRTQTQI